MKKNNSNNRECIFMSQMVFQMNLNLSEILLNGPGVMAHAFKPNTVEVVAGRCHVSCRPN